MNHSAAGLSLQSLLSDEPAPTIEQAQDDNNVLVAEKFPVFAPGAIDRKLVSGTAILTAFTKLPGFTAITAINPELLPADCLPPNYTVPTVINPLLSFTLNKYDGLSWAQLFLNTELPQSFIAEVSEYIKTLYFGSGTIVGLTRRMKSQLPIPANRAGKVTQQEYLYVKSILNHSQKAHLKGEGATILNLSPVLNADAHPGAPYFKAGVSVKDVIKKELTRATQFLSILNDSGAAGLVKHLSQQQNVPYSVTMLSAKSDIYERSQYLTKTRPFGVIPLSHRLIFACITAAMKDNQTNFLSNEESISAMGFSWTDGGAQTLMDWITKIRPPGFKALSWGDDQIVQVTCRDGSTFIVCPDVSGMDMKLQGPTFDLFQAWLLDQFTEHQFAFEEFFSSEGLDALLAHESTSIDERWLSAIMYFVYYAKKHPLLTYKHYLFYQQCGLISGLNGTTLFDMVASARLHYHLKEVPIPDDLTGVTEYTDRMVIASHTAGFPLKLDSMQVQVIREKHKPAHYMLHKGTKSPIKEDIELNLTFLGMKLRRTQVEPLYCVGDDPLYILVPFLEPKDVIAHCVLKAPSAKDPLEKASLAMESLLGMGLMGGTDPLAYSYLSQCFNLRVSMKQTLLVKVHEVSDVMKYDMTEFNGITEYPPLSYFLKIFASPEDKAKISARLHSASGESSSQLNAEEEDIVLPKLRSKKTVSAPVEDDEDTPMPTLSRHKPSKMVPLATKQVLADIEESQSAPAAPAPVPIKSTSSQPHTTTKPPILANKAKKQALYRARADAMYMASLRKKSELIAARSRKRRKGMAGNDAIAGVPDDEDAAIALYDEWAEALEQEEDRLRAMANQQSDPSDNEQSESETEEEKYYDPTNAKNRQGAGWFLE